MRLVALHLSQSAAHSEALQLLPHQWNVSLVRNVCCCQGRPHRLCTPRNWLRVSLSPCSASYLPSVWTTVYSSVLPARQTETETDTSVEAPRLNTSCFFSDAFGRRPRSYICLGIIARTSENEAFKGGWENNDIYSWTEGDIPSFFQGQVPASLCSAPIVVAAGQCV